MKVLKVFFIILFSTISNLYAQRSFFGIDSIFILPDTVETLSLDDFNAMVLSFHPIVKQAKLLTEQGQQEIRLARGAFDPKLKGSWDFKDFESTRYFNIINTSLTIPTWLPIDVKVGFDRNLGEFLNPENSIPNSNDNEQLNFGLNFVLGKGFLIDERRASLKKAKIFSNIAEAKQIKEINKILLTATKDYWNWYYSYFNFRLFSRSVEIAQNVFERVKLNYELGEAAVIDTVQAKITLQERLTDAQKARIDFLQSSLMLSNHLWGANNVPLELRENTVPNPIDEQLFSITQQELFTLLNQAEANHPEIRKLNFKLDQLQIDNKLFREALKPELDFDYAFIDQPRTTTGEQNGFSLEDNFKFGVNFSYPLFLRKERAKIRKNELKSQETILERNYRRQQILAEINATYVKIVNSNEILNQQQQAVQGYQRLVEAEFLNLESGESDLFKINAQQEKFIQSYSKFLKTRTDLEKSKVELFWAAGIQNLNFID